MKHKVNWTDQAAFREWFVERMCDNQYAARERDLRSNNRLCDRVAAMKDLATEHDKNKKGRKTMLNPLIFNSGAELVRGKPIGNSLKPSNEGQREYYYCATCPPKIGKRIHVMYSATECLLCKNEREAKSVVPADGPAVAPTAKGCGVGLVWLGTHIETPEAKAFKVGDVVECLPDADWQRDSDFVAIQVGKVGQIWCMCAFYTRPCVAINGLEYNWPISALRHAETKPQDADGWQLLGDVRTNAVSVWGNMRLNYALAFQYADGHWQDQLDNHYSSWIELKRTLEGQNHGKGAKQ